MSSTASKPFVVKDCALVAIATGRRAANLKELSERLQTADLGCVYYHFWGRLLRPLFDAPEFINDFAVWAGQELQDPVLAERLAIVDPTDFSNLEELRQELVELVEERLDEREYVPWARRGRQFHFVRSQIVVFHTRRNLSTVEEMSSAIPELSLGSLFYHFIDARRRHGENLDDFRAWLEGLGDGYGDLCRQLAAVDPYFVSLAKLRLQIGKMFEACVSRRAS